MAVSIRLSRAGRVHLPYYHIAVYNTRTRRDGRPIEEIGLYDPTGKKDQHRLDAERAKYWLSQGAKPSATVATILKQNGFTSSDWTPARRKPSKPKAAAKPVGKKATAKKSADKDQSKKAKARKPRTASSHARGEKKRKVSAS